MARKKVPDSVAQKSHRLLFASIAATERFVETGEGWDRAVKAGDALRNHIQRIAKGGRK